MRQTRIRRQTLITICLAASFLLFVLFLIVFWKHLQEIHPREIPALVINEVCPANPGTALDEKTTTYEDYIELYNPTDSAVSLKDFYLSDDTKKPLAGPLPDVEIAAEGYYCVYAVGKDGSMPEGVPSVPFALTSGETVTLSTLAMSESGVTRPVTVDTVTLPSQQTADTVYARIEDGADTFSEMRPSPGSSNQEAGVVPEAPKFQTAEGFYEDQVDVVISTEKGLTIHYTLDGSEPTLDSPVYTRPLRLQDPSSQENVWSARRDIVAESDNYTPPVQAVDKIAVVRAAAFDEEGHASNAVTASYFLDFDEKTGYDHAIVVSLVTDPENLFGFENGIYVRGELYENGILNGDIYPEFPWTDLMDYLNYYQDGMDSERQAHLSIFSSKHNLLLEQDCGIRIRGNESRSFAQKSFTLFSRKRYGSDGFSPVLFDSGISYPDLILNNSYKLKKVFFFSLMEDRDAVEHYRLCQVFLNGEYWGMYFLMEKYSSEYVEGYYDVDADDVLMVKATQEVQEGDPSDISRFRELQEYLKQDLSDPLLYAGLLERMDMQSFIDWMCTNIYIANTDTKPLGGNVYTWQSTVPDNVAYNDGKWRWMLYDLDDSLAVSTQYEETPWEMDSFVEHAGYAPSGFLDDDPMPNLMANAQFREQFVLTFLDLANENFSPEQVNAHLDQLAETYTDQADLSWQRWNTVSQYETFPEQIEELRTFFEKRFDAIVPYLAEHFDLTGDLVTLTLSQEGDGTVTLNSISPDLSGQNWSGRYYTDYPVTLTAEAPEGYSFVGWEIEGGETVSGSASDAQIQVRLETDTEIRAVFEENND